MSPSSAGVDINYAGQILVNGRDKRTNTHHAFIASPMEYQVSFIAPATGARPKAGSTVPIKVALVDINGKRISDARALSLVAAPCQVKFSASGAQTKTASCMKYDATNNVFFFNWKLGTAGTGAGKHQGHRHLPVQRTSHGYCHTVAADHDRSLATALGTECWRYDLTDKARFGGPFLSTPRGIPHA